MAYPNGMMPASARTFVPPFMQALAYAVDAPHDVVNALLRVRAAMLADIGVGLTLTDGYRPRAAQVRVFKERYLPGSKSGADNRTGPDGRTWHRVIGAPVAAFKVVHGQVVSTSNHGQQHPAAADLSAGVQVFGSAANQWMDRRGPEFGFDHPTWAWQGARTPEPWHREWHRSMDRHYGEPIAYVRAVQQALVERGHRLTVDGLVGPEWNENILNFQAARPGQVGKADRIPGVLTMAALGLTEHGALLHTTEEDLTVAQIDQLFELINTCLAETRAVRADLDRAMNYIDESDPRDPKYGSFVLQRTAQTNHQIGAWQRDLEERDALPDPLPGTTIEETQ